MNQIIFFVKKLWLFFQNRQNLYRSIMLERAMDFARHNKLEGHYFEFGVYAGTTFQYAYHAAKDRGLQTMRFYALDSFEGFSEPKGHDDIGLITEGTRDCSEKQFLRNVKRQGVPLKIVTTVKGWFADTLEGAGAIKTNEKLGNAQVAVLWMDADLYEPTISALNFVTPRLEDGTVIMFDNWFLFKGHPERGERKACTEWLEKNPHIMLTPFYNFSWHGASFIINLPLD
jgi:hypothetical protein